MSLAHRARAIRPLPADLPALLAGATVLLAAALYIPYSLAQWRGYQVPSWDLAIFSQAVKAYAHGQAPIVPVKGPGFNLLGDHFHPILVLLAPLWRLWPSPLTLLIAQDLLLAASAWPLTRLAVRSLGPIAGAALGLAYITSWGLQGAVGAQFHEIAFAVPMLAWAGAAYVRRRWLVCAAWLTPLVLVKEDLGLTVLMGGLAIAWQAWWDGRRPTQPPAAVRLGRWRVDGVGLGLALAAWGTGWFLLTVLVLLPALSPTGAWQYGLGGNTSDGSAPRTPTGSILERLLTPEIKRRTLALLAGSAGVIGLASPWITLVLPALAWRFLSGKETYWDWRLWHYNAVLIPIALAALLDVAARLRARRQPVPATEGPAGLVPGGQASAGQASAGRVPTSPVSSALPSSSQPAPARPGWTDRLTGGWTRVPRWAAATAGVGVLITCLAAWHTAPALQLTGTDPYRPLTPARIQAADAAASRVPDGASVETDLTLLAALVPRTTVYWVGTSGEAEVSYVLLDTQSWAWGRKAPGDAAAWATQRHGGTWRIIYSQDGFQLAQRVRP